MGHGKLYSFCDPHTQPPFRHSSHTVLVAGHLPVGVGDGPHAVRYAQIWLCLRRKNLSFLHSACTNFPTVVGVLHLERIGVCFIREHKSMIIFNHFAHSAVKKCLETGDVGDAVMRETKLRIRFELTNQSLYKLNNLCTIPLIQIATTIYFSTFFQ